MSTIDRGAASQHPPKLKSLKPGKMSWKTDWKRNKLVYLLFLPVFVYFLIVHYLPMFGIVMAFQNFRLARGIFDSPWVGFENFSVLFSGDAFPNAIRNTVIMSLFNLTLAFSAPIAFALLITSMPFKRIRRISQTISYLPNFVAVVVVANLIQIFLGYDGVLTAVLTSLGFEQQNWLANPNPPVFWLIYTFSGIWQGFGYGSIMFVAAISNVSEDLYEAAAIDGANRWQRTWRITLPGILPLIVMMLTLMIGITFKVGYDKVLLLYMPQTYAVADNVFTYTYRMAFGSAPDFGLAASSGLFQSVVGTILLVLSNKLGRRLTESSLF